MKRRALLYIVLLMVLGRIIQCVPPSPAADGKRDTPEPVILPTVTVPVHPRIPTYGPSSTPSEAITANVEVGTPIELGRNVPITVTAHSNVAIPTMRVVVAFWQGSTLLQGKPDWRVNDVRPDQTVQLTTTLVFPARDRYLLRPEFWGGNCGSCMYALVIDLSRPGAPLIATATPYPYTPPPRPLLSPTPAPARPAGTWIPSPPTRAPKAARPTP